MENAFPLNAMQNSMTQPNWYLVRFFIRQKGGWGHQDKMTRWAIIFKLSWDVTWWRKARCLVMSPAVGFWFRRGEDGSSTSTVPALAPLLQRGGRFTCDGRGKAELSPARHFPHTCHRLSPSYASSSTSPSSPPTSPSLPSSPSSSSPSPSQLPTQSATSERLSE